MRTITSSGTLTDTKFEGRMSEVIFGIQVFEPGGKQDLAEVGFVLRKDGRDIPNGEYDLENKANGELFHLRKTPSGWKVDAGQTIILNNRRTGR